MEPLNPEGVSKEWRAHPVNDEWKARWNTRVAWSTTAAALIHVAVFSFGPRWDVRRPRPDPDLERLEMASISFYEAPASGRGAALGAVPIAALSDSVLVEADAGEEADGSETTTGDFAEILRQRLLHRGGVVPTVAEPEPEPETESPTAVDQDGSGDESASIEGGRASAAEIDGLPEPTSMDLSRLSALRPDIVLAGVSAWVLVMNPAEVLRFMRDTFARERLPEGVSGSASVVLFINERGSVEWAEISQSSRIPRVDEILLQLFNEVVAFRPARDQGVPVPRSAVFSVSFPW